MTLEQKYEIALEALAFYADPETYFATSIFSDPPCGEIVHDYSNEEPGLEGLWANSRGPKPGMRARRALVELGELP